MLEETKKTIDFIEYLEGLKLELRHTWLSNDRRESVAEHSWRMSVMALIIAPKTKLALNMEKILKMTAIHDIAEIETGDVPASVHLIDEKIANKKAIDEIHAMEIVRKLMNDESGEELYELWHEFEEQITNESKFVKIIDKFEAVIQKYQTGYESFKRQDELGKYGVPGYLEKLEEMCKIDDYLMKILHDLVERRKNIKADRISRLN